MIIVRLSGGMGNQMFQYACGRALSIKRNVPLALDLTFLLEIDRTILPLLRPRFTPRDFDLDVFNINARIAEPSEIPWHGRPFFSGKAAVLADAVLRKVPILPGWEKSPRFDEKILDLGPDAYLAGFWQSEKYFSEIADIIREDFTLKDPLSEKSQELSDEIRNASSVCVHVRRADILAKSFHAQIGQEYYDRAIAHIAKSHPIGKIYVFSDDMEWCEQNLRFSFPTMFVGNEYAGMKGREHFALMSACRHFIIPNSTFSWWAAWLGNNPDKVVIAPKRWFAGDIIGMIDFLPEKWIKL